ncbi:MAG: GNAT family N-acetyltransferase [Rhodobiaceae bacterium]|nr:GNAT family N-acetyltransferase [Rhodobiaceae bacterium]MCC0055173.1 GNAT family N-acetyltransferase [Rhodobiaceae bacterium]
MAGKPATLRPATVDDARAIAELFLISSDGLAAYIWRKVDPGASDLLDVGERRYARTGIAFSFENCTIAKVDGEIAGMLHGFGMETRGEPDEDPVLRPYSELEEAPSFYIAGVAVHERFARRGIGTQLVEAAAARARLEHFNCISLIVFEQNRPALELYQRLGFAEVARRPLVPCPELHYSQGDALLMVAPV